ncbi:hypothetical protein JKG47_01120 [Acidithiobacillus sp. MC6.1]|nr:hypothetical protein [Acidithiobacillus sp. MC6.1]
MIRPTILLAVAAASVTMLNGCGLMLPSPTISAKKSSETSLSTLSAAARKGDADCGSKKCVLHRFYAMGPGTVAVQDLLAEQQGTPKAQRALESTTGSAMLLGATTLGITSGPGIALALLGLGSGGSLPKWADHYRWMRKGTLTGYVFQVVYPYKIGSDPEASARQAMLKASTQAIHYMNDLKYGHGTTYSVRGSSYVVHSSNGKSRVCFVGKNYVMRNGGFSMTWWFTSQLTIVGAILFGEGSMSGGVGILGRFMHRPIYWHGDGGSFYLSEVSGTPLPGEPSQGLAVITFINQYPSEFIGSTARARAIKDFRGGYLIMDSTKTPSDMGIWHNGKQDSLDLPALKR